MYTTYYSIIMIYYIDVYYSIYISFIIFQLVIQKYSNMQISIIQQHALHEDIYQSIIIRTFTIYIICTMRVLHVSQ